MTTSPFGDTIHIPDQPPAKLALSEANPMTEPTNRRTFLKASAATVAATAVLPGAYAAAGNEVLRVGLVGCGGRGTGAAREALRADPNTKLVAMCDAFMDRL